MLLRRLGILQLLLKLWDDAVHQLTGALELPAALRNLQLAARVIESLLQLLGAGKGVLFRLPLGRQLGRTLV